MAFAEAAAPFFLPSPPEVGEGPGVRGKRQADFVRLALAHRRFAAWDRQGPDPAEPDPGVGILHHYLAHSLASSQPD